MLEQKRLAAALQKQKQEDEILAESMVFRENDKLRAQFDFEKQKMVRGCSSFWSRLVLQH